MSVRQISDPAADQIFTPLYVSDIVACFAQDRNLPGGW